MVEGEEEYEVEAILRHKGEGAVKPSPVETQCLQVAAAAHCSSERAFAACCEPMTHNQWQPELSH